MASNPSNKGFLPRTWEWEVIEPGTSVQAIWDGKDGAGNIVPPGDYTYTAFAQQLISYFSDIETGTITVVLSRAHRIRGVTSPIRGNWLKTQSFAEYLEDSNHMTYDGYHSGEDWSFRGKGARAKIYTIAPGKVVWITPITASLGHLIVVEHTGVFTISKKPIRLPVRHIIILQRALKRYTQYICM